MVSTIVSGYITLLDLDRQLEIAQATLDGRKRNVEVFQMRLDGGAVSEFEMMQVTAEYETAVAAIPVLQQAIAQQEHALSVLIGRNPGPIRRGRTLQQLTAPPVPGGLPSDLIARRPDILQAEQQLVAANALIGAARALYFPTVSLTAFGGGASRELSDLFAGPSRTWSFAGQLLGPIFAGGAIDAANRQAQARRDQVLEAYQEAIQSAFRDVDDALVAIQAKRALIASPERQVVALTRAVELARYRYDNGYTDYLEVFDTERRLFSAELSLSSARGDGYRSLVDLYRALGGDWIAQIAPLPVAQHPHKTRPPRRRGTHSQCPAIPTVSQATRAPMPTKPSTDPKATVSAQADTPAGRCTTRCCSDQCTAGAQHRAGDAGGVARDVRLSEGRRSIAFALASLLRGMPIVLFGMIALCMFLAFHAMAHGKARLPALLLLICLATIPVVVMIAPAKAGILPMALIRGIGLALLLIGIVYVLWPRVMPPTSATAATPVVATPLALALVSTAIVVPLILVYLLFGLADALPVTVATVMLVANFDLQRGRLHALGMVAGNVTGGLLGVFVYGLLLTTPTLPFLAGLLFVLLLGFGQRIVAGGATAAVALIACNTMLIILSSAITSGPGLLSLWLTRLAQFVLAGVFAVSMMNLLWHHADPRHSTASPSAGP